MRAGRQARLHDREILIGQRKVHDMRRADRADQRRGRVDMVGVDFGGLDRDPRAFLHRLGDRVAFELARSEEPTSELQSLMRIPYAVFRWKKKTYKESS